MPEDDYGLFVGLWLNVPRIRFASAAMTLAGVSAAHHSEALDELWFDALARFPEETAELMDKVNRERGKRQQIALALRGMMR